MASASPSSRIPLPKSGGDKLGKGAEKSRNINRYETFVKKTSAFNDSDLNAGSNGDNENSVANNKSPSRIPVVSNNIVCNGGEMAARKLSPDEFQVHTEQTVEDDLKSPNSSSSRIPLPNSSKSINNNKGLPTVGFSLSPERMLNRTCATITNKGDDKVKIDVHTSDDIGNHNHSGINNKKDDVNNKFGDSRKVDDDFNKVGESNNTSVDAVDDSFASRRQFEAFVMTGERMIHLTKTPANDDFKSKYKNNEVAKPTNKLNVLPFEGDFYEDDEIDSNMLSDVEKDRTLEEATDEDVLQVEQIESDQVTEAKRNDGKVNSEQFSNPSSLSTTTTTKPLSQTPSASPSQATTTAALLPSSASSTSLDDEGDSLSLRSYHPPVKEVDVPSAVRLAKRLYHLDGFHTGDVSRHLSKNTDYNKVVAQEYVNHFDFSAMTLDEALRLFLSRFSLEGETQERERVLNFFAKRYLSCNAYLKEQKLLRSEDATHTLTCALMLLNTDLHGQHHFHRGRAMSADEFRENLVDLNDNENFPPELLTKLYNAVKHKPLTDARKKHDSASTASTTKTMADDKSRRVHKEAVSPSALAHKTSSITTPSSESIDLRHTNPFLPSLDTTSAEALKSGYVMRKCCVLKGKRVGLGHRSWHMRYVTLHSMALICYKDEKHARDDLKRREADREQHVVHQEDQEVLRLHHSLAVRAADYKKKPFVFRLHTADRSEYLFQATDENELVTWIDLINLATATHSAPELPAACGSKTHQENTRPLLPASKSRLSVEEQLESHERHLVELHERLRAHLETLPRNADKKKSKRERKENEKSFRERSDYLHFETMRYEAYVMSLRSRKRKHSVSSP